jgi:hypothetical protein
MTGAHNAERLMPVSVAVRRLAVKGLAAKLDHRDLLLCLFILKL